MITIKSTVKESGDKEFSLEVQTEVTIDGVTKYVGTLFANEQQARAAFDYADAIGWAVELIQEQQDD